MCKYCEAPNAKVEPKTIELVSTCTNTNTNTNQTQTQTQPIEIDLHSDGSPSRPIFIPTRSSTSNSSNNAAAEVIDLISDDDEDDDDDDIHSDTALNKKRNANNNANANNNGNAKKKIKLEFEPKKFGEANDPEGDVIEVLPPVCMSSEKKDFEISISMNDKSTEEEMNNTSNTSNEDDDEVVFLSTTAIMSRDLPHARHSCPVHKFTKGSYDAQKNVNTKVFSKEVCASNAKHCPQCYCYVCDVPARECTKWDVKHCNASDDAYDGNGRWRKERELLANPFGRMLLLQNTHITCNTNENILDITREAVRDLDEAFSSYEYGNRRYRDLHAHAHARRHVLDMFGIFGGNSGYYGSEYNSEDDSDYDDYDGNSNTTNTTYDHDFSTVSGCLRRKLNTVDNYLGVSAVHNLVEQPSKVNTGQGGVSNSPWLLRNRQLADFVGSRFVRSGGLIDILFVRLYECFYVWVITW